MRKLAVTNLLTVVAVATTFVVGMAHASQQTGAAPANGPALIAAAVIAVGLAGIPARKR